MPLSGPLNISIRVANRTSISDFESVFKPYMTKDPNNTAESVSDSAVTVSELRSGRLPGAFDTAFYVALALSFPIGITASLVANWLSARLSEAATRSTPREITLAINNKPVSIDLDAFEKVNQTINEIRSLIDEEP